MDEWKSERAGGRTHWRARVRAGIGFELAIDEIQFFVYALRFKLAALSQPVDLPNPEIFKLKYVLSDQVFLALHYLYRERWKYVENTWISEFHLVQYSGRLLKT